MKQKLFFILTLFIGIVFSINCEAQSPSITGFLPSSGSVGTLITITGTNLGNPTAFTVGGVTAIVVSNDGSTLVGLIMPGTATGVVSITTVGGTANGAINFNITPTSYPSIQQGAKLVGTGANGIAEQGWSVSLSADGNTAIVGGYYDSIGQGAVWIYTRNGGVWTQQGNKLVGTGGDAYSSQGCSVSLSADGNTAIVGGYYYNSGEGAVWVFTRSGGVWTQQGAKLIGTGANGGAEQGYSVSLSADGNTAIIGGYYDNSGIGAIWVFTRSGGVWTQEGNKLVGTGASGSAFQGTSVSLSADGNTAIVGGYNDNSGEGAVWMYTRSGSVWTQQGSKLVGAGANGSAFQGTSVSLSADGNTAIVGGNTDSSATGAAWIYIRNGGVWTQQGAKLVGTGFSEASEQGYSVSLSADGNTAIIGGINDSSGVGAIWVYTRSGGVWTQQGSKLVGTGGDANSQQGTSVSLSADANTTITGGYNDNAGHGAAWIFATCDNFGDTTSMACKSFTWYGTTYTSSESPIHIFNNIRGCDSTVTLHLTIPTIDTNVAQTGNVLTASANTATYQWIKCGSIDSIITGATNQSYTPTANGYYAVVVNEGACSDTSSCHNVTTTGIIINSLNTNNIKVSPIPNDGHFEISFTGLGYQSITIYNEVGEKISEQLLDEKNPNISLNLNLSEYPSGIYFAKILTSHGEENKKILIQK